MHGFENKTVDEDINMKTIVCFGDSNTHGYNAENFGRFSKNVRWTGVLQDIIGEQYDVKEEGLSGRTCVFDDPLFEGLNGYRAIAPVLLTHEPVDLLIIMLGTNDTKERFSSNATNIAKGLERLVAKAKDRVDAWQNGISNILIIAPPPIEDGYKEGDCGEEMGKGCVEKSVKLASVYEVVASRLGCHYLDAGSIDGIEMSNKDFMHLTADSHRKLAEELAKRLNQYLR